ncbi:hypothetical protein [Ruegeria lacuscaerulensis]|uniref:hypothetical protein n=1 Tax=Ruegeria lacuscaerulensis TaxID=55218 RepID=UPI00147A351D|nr:hypothetical protein [Ruegeria lacuscaerulensis]
MQFVLKIILLLSFTLGWQACLASPKEDARLVARRSIDPEILSSVEALLKKQFVDVYFKPLSQRGIKINDIERFADLIPDEDVAPFLDRMMSQTVENYLTLYTPEQLSLIATIMRNDDEATLEEIRSEQYRQQYILALEQSRSTAKKSGSDDPLTIGLEELVVQLDTVAKLLEGEFATNFAQDFASGIGFVFILVRFNQEIARIEREFDNPVTIAALNGNGILKFANPVQKQTLLRELSASEDTGGVRFIRPTSREIPSE